MTATLETPDAAALGGETPRGTSRQVAALHLGDEIYGVDIAAIHTVLTPQPITQVPNVPAYVRGVMNLRGRILPVLDLRARFGLPPLPADDAKQSRIVIVEAGGQAAGLVVDGVSEVLRIDDSAIEPAAALLGAADRRCLAGIGRVPAPSGPDQNKNGGQKDGRLILLLDVPEVLDSVGAAR